jgi:hypothetical protein
MKAAAFNENFLKVYSCVGSLCKFSFSGSVLLNPLDTH